jgi:hypothetical protein
MMHFLILSSYLIMMFLPIFIMLVMSHHSEELWEQAHHKRLLKLLNYKGHLKKGLHQEKAYF